MKKKIAKLGIIAVLTFALILSSLGALPFGDTLAKEFDIGAKNQTTAQAAEGWDGTTKTAPTGTGASDNPYLIGTAEQLAYVAEQVNTVTDYSKDKFFKLTANIELNVTTGWDGWTDKTAGLNAWTPIGTSANAFNGTFDGNGKTVSGIYINDTNESTGMYKGLFGHVRAAATIKNVGVINSYIKGNAYVGGVAGHNYGSIINCYNTGAVNGSESVGGVVGWSADGAVANSYNTGAVSGMVGVGGVVGTNDHVAITNCYNTGAVSGTTIVGGVVGWNTNGAVANCYFLTNQITIGGTLGAGNAVGTSAGTGTATNCSPFGAEKQLTTVGDTEPNQTTNKALVTFGANADLLATLNLGRAKYNELNTSATQAAEWVEVTNNYPTFKVEGGVTPPIPDPTPITPANKFAGGNGSKETPYLIGTPEELAYLAQQVNAEADFSKGKFFKLTTSMELNDTTDWKKWGATAPAKVWIPIGNDTKAFQGTFDGDGNIIVGIYISGSADNQGLFGKTSDTATVKNVGVVDSYIKGQTQVGGVAGLNNGKVINCYNTGVVTGDQMAGGIVGNNYGAVINCYNRDAVSEGNKVGGVVGQNWSGTVENCYNTGAVSARNSNAGGVVGYNNAGAVTNSYFLKNEKVNTNLNAVGTATDTKTDTCGSFEGTNSRLSSEVDSVIGSSLLEALKAGATAYNTANPTATQAMEWVYVSGGYPNFKAGGGETPPEPTKPFAKGDGSVDAPYEISTAEELTKLSELINAANATYSVEGVHYKLTADIKLNGDKTITSASTDATPWNSIGESGVIPFFGVFDGDGHTVSGIYIKNNDQFQGLFGVVGSDTVKTATIKNVGVINSYIEGNGNTGGIVGANSGAVINCYNLGAVTAKGDNVGGVVGGNIGEVINCYNRGDVQQVNESDNNCGGVVGLNVGKVLNCYNNGAVTGTSNVGDVVGSNTGSGTTVANCYFSIESGLSAVGVNETNSHVTNCATFNARKNLTADGATPAKTEGALITFKVGAELLTTLNEGAKAYNDDNTSKTQAMAWANGADDYPTLKAVVTPPTPPAGGGDSDSEPSISPEDIFWTGIVTDLKHKDEPVVEFNCKYPRMSRRVLVALQEVDKTLNINLNGEKISLTSKQVKPLTFDKMTYSVAELKALIEVKPEVTPTPTPTPTEKPTEPVVPEKPATNLTWLWILLAVIAVGAVVFFIVVKKKKNDDNK